MQVDAADRLKRCADDLAQVRADAPRVHCLTNDAAANLTANGLLALGAVPSLSDHVDEVAAFTANAGALSINLGTPDEGRLAAIDLAVKAARDSTVPWVLDPVMIERAPTRRIAARRLVEQSPDVLRLNAAEKASLFDSHDAPPFDGVLAISGAEDRLTQGDKQAVITNGHPLMARMTGAGCLLGAVTGAFLAVERDPFQAAVAASLTVAIAGEMAGEEAQGPGSFHPALLDALARIRPQDLMEKARLTCAP